MVIQEKGKYKLMENWCSRGPQSTRFFKKGDILKITGVDFQAHKVVGLKFRDWTHWDIPVIDII